MVGEIDEGKKSQSPQNVKERNESYIIKKVFCPYVCVSVVLNESKFEIMVPINLISNCRSHK